MKSSRPWRWQRRVLRATLPEGTRIAAELEELFVRRLRLQSPLRAHGWHTRQVIGLMLRAPILWHARRAKGRVAHRDVGRFRWLDDLVQDVRLAVRTLLKDRGFTAVVILTLGVAIGASTAIFSVVDAVLLRPLPYPEAEEIVTIGLSNPGSYEGDATRGRFPDTAYRHFRQRNRSFEEFGAFRSDWSVLIGNGAPRQLSVGLMTNSVYAVLGIPPLRGRLPSEGEDIADGPLVTVLSHGLWVTRFGADSDVIGSMIQLDDRIHEVIAIMRPEFAFPGNETDLWIPLQLDPESRRPGNLRVVGRLRDGATLESATMDAESLVQSFEEAGYEPTSFARTLADRASVQTLKEGIVGDSRALLVIVMGAVSFVLLIACANVANLFLVRAEGRVRQTAVRTALGATRRRLIQSVLTESLLLALVGGLGGLLLALTGVRVLVANAPAGIPRLDGVGMNATVFWYTAGVSVLAGLLFGLLPTIRTGSSAKVTAALTDGGRGATVGRDRLRFRGVLVVTEVALALVLLIGSGLMVRSFQKLRSVDLGVDPDGVVTFGLTLPAARYPGADEQTQFFDQLLGRVRALPGVEAAGATTYLPLKGGPSLRLDVEEFMASSDEYAVLEARWVTPGYFEAMGVPVLSGRTVEPRDHQERLRSLFISASLKEQYWPNTSALGKRLGPAGWGEWGEVVGVVGDVHTEGLKAVLRPLAVYLTLDWTGPWSALTMSVAVRQSGDPSELVPQLRREVAALDPAIPLTDIETMDDIVRDSMSRTSFTMSLLVLAAFVAVFLGSVGIYGVISYVVSRRTSELGVRKALGADAANIRSLVLRRGMTSAVIGVALGLGTAALMSRMLTSLLFQTSPFDPLTFVSGPILFLVIAAIACIAPARKAAGVDPTEALRSD